MSGFTTNTISNLTRSLVYTSNLKEVLEDELFGQRYIRWMTDFPDGDTWNQPSIGQAEVLDYSEDQAVKFTAMDTGNFTFTINEYVQSGTYITNKFKQDSYVADQAVAMFVPSHHHAIMKDLETKIFATGPDNQTASNTNTINGAYHRFVGSGASETMSLQDFMYARYALHQANVPLTNMVAIVDPSVEVALSLQTNVVNLMNPQPQWQTVVTDGLSSAGLQFRFNIYGWDIYTSMNLKQNATSETIDSKTAAAGVNNLFFSATPDLVPFIGAIRQPVKVDTQYNMNFQRDEYVTTMRYGLALHRPENLVVVLTDTDQVYA